MSNSPLIDKTILSPNHYNGRYEGYYSKPATIYKITPHCMAADLTIEQCGNGFANPKRNASSNYGIESSGRIALFVEEKNGSWCSSDKDNDIHAVTVEIACSPVQPYRMTDKAIESFINLTVDVMERNGLNKLVWKKTLQATNNYKRKTGECLLTVHRWFAAKACPGDYFIGKIPYIVKDVNNRLEYNRLKKKGTFKIKTTIPGVRCYNVPGDRVIRRLKMGATVNVAKVKMIDGIIWAQGAKTKQWFKMVHTKIL